MYTSKTLHQSAAVSRNRRNHTANMQLLQPTPGGTGNGRITSNYKNTWKHKHNVLKAQVKLYDDFLLSEPLTFEKRMAIINEMARLNETILRIRNMNMNELEDDTLDYNIVINSRL